MIDPSYQMIKVARERNALRNRATFRKGLAEKLPYPDESFNLVLACQMLQHIASREDRILALEEMKRVVIKNNNKNNILILNVTTPTQVEHGYWWSALLPKTTENYKTRFFSIEELAILLDKENKNRLEISVPKQQENILMGRFYLNIYGPFYTKWRSGDSTWALVDDKELNKCQNDIEKLVKKGQVDEFLETRELARKRVGQTSYLTIAFKDV